MTNSPGTEQVHVGQKEMITLVVHSNPGLQVKKVGNSVALNSGINKLPIHFEGTNNQGSLLWQCFDI